MADNDVVILDQSATPVAFKPRSKDRGNNVREFVHGLSNSIGTQIDPATDGTLSLMLTTLGLIAKDATVAKDSNLVSILNALNNVISVTQVPFRPEVGATKELAVTSTATSNGAIKVAESSAGISNTVNSIRIRSSADSTGPVYFVLTTDVTRKATVPTPYAADGSGGSLGDVSIDPGSVEIMGLTTAQKTALLAGSLYISAITKSGVTASLSISPGTGA